MSTQNSSNFHNLKSKLEHHHKKVVSDFHEKHKHVIHRAKKHSMTLASSAVIATSIITGHQNPAQNTKQAITKQKQDESLNAFLKQFSKVAKEKSKLNESEEQVIAEALSKKFDLDLRVILDEHRLNEIIGYIGAEQHLKRWNGDSLTQHNIQKAGMAPLQGAFKDFDNAEQEKYYVAVQIHEIPGWDKNWSEWKPWYRYRKVFVYNPDNQRGIVAVIGDAGPAKWTGKTFGGSPEVMEYLQRVDGAQKGKVIILFIDDPDNKIALGPADELNKPLALK